MITGLAMKAVAFFITIITFPLPSWTLPQEWTDFVADMWSNVLGLNYIFPTTLLLGGIVGIVFFEIAIGIFRLTAGLISIIRGGGEIKI